jgi:hypothetical protein
MTKRGGHGKPAPMPPLLRLRLRARGKQRRRRSGPGARGNPSACMHNYCPVPPPVAAAAAALFPAGRSVAGGRAFPEKRRHTQ